MSKVIRSEDYLSWQAPSVMRDHELSQPKMTAEDIENIKQMARREGFNRGYREGKATGEKYMLQKSQAIQQIIHALVAPLSDLDDQVEEELLQLAIAVAKQIVRRELKLDPRQVIAVVREAMAGLPVSSQQVQIHLHAEDAKLLEEAFHYFTEENANIRIVEDPLLQRGECKVASQSSHIDASLDNRMAQIAARILGGERDSDGQ